MLRESSNIAGEEYDLAPIMGQGTADSGVEHSAILLAMAASVLGNDETEKQTARNKLRQTLGDAAYVDTCAIIASFNAVVKIADATGIPLEDEKAKKTQDIRANLSIDDFLS